mmetsp:Transcript_5099/g.17787  ORF Transcript_5099/g.17787 Transcript_5099/m.17787 type:complete len:201 (+) Transcript_5099:388-990(+)
MANHRALDRHHDRHLPVQLQRGLCDAVVRHGVGAGDGALPAARAATGRVRALLRVVLRERGRQEVRLQAIHDARRKEGHEAPRAHHRRRRQAGVPLRPDGLQLPQLPERRVPHCHHQVHGRLQVQRPRRRRRLRHRMAQRHVRHGGLQCRARPVRPRPPRLHHRHARVLFRDPVARQVAKQAPRDAVPRPVRLPLQEVRA